MEQSSASEILAQWQVYGDDWKNFVNYELRAQIKSQRAFRKWFFGILVVVLLVAAFFLLMPFLIWGSLEWNEDVYGPIFAAVLIGGIFLLVLGILWLVHRNKIASLKTPTGDVQIMLNRVGINGVWFSWVYETNGWRLKEISRKTIDLGGGQNIELLEFKFFSRNTHGDFQGDEKIERVPVPQGEHIEAERIVRRLEAEKRRFDEE